jgi:Holliday junction resolvasome RuvABC DNA-binding subunit
MIYLQGKVINTLESQVLVRLSNGIGYLLDANPSNRYETNQVYEFYIILDPSVIGPNQRIYALDSFEEWLIMKRLVEANIPISTATKIIHELGVGQLQKAITTKDDTLLKRIPNLNQKYIKQIMDIGDEVINIGLSNASLNNIAGAEIEGVTKVFTYTSSEFSERMQKLRYSSNKIVEVITVLKREDLWGKIPLADLIKKSISYIEDGYIS